MTNELLQMISHGVSDTIVCTQEVSAKQIDDRTDLASRKD